MIIGIILIILIMIIRNQAKKSRLEAFGMPNQSMIDEAEKIMAKQIGVTKFIKKSNRTVKFAMTYEQLIAFEKEHKEFYTYTIEYDGEHYIVDNMQPK